SGRWQPAASARRDDDSARGSPDRILRAGTIYYIVDDALRSSSSRAIDEVGALSGFEPPIRYLPLPASRRPSKSEESSKFAQSGNR
ncbi:MAG TPA: hypothetical protein PKD64_12525, partial [Pirellulaceae bacterium]|nr:hypothetical protein [Pirellulaceae bacterium]